MKKRSCEDYFGESKMRFYFLVCRKPTSRSALYVSNRCGEDPNYSSRWRGCGCCQKWYGYAIQPPERRPKSRIASPARCRLAAVQLGCAIALGEENRLRWVPTP